MTTTLSWVIGRGGLLGRHVEATLLASGRQDEAWRPERDIRWPRIADAATDLEAELREFFDLAAGSGHAWRLLWCAGAGVVATPPEALAQETNLLQRFLGAVDKRVRGDQALADAGTLFFASSAGGVYAASRAQPPFDEESPVGAMGRYGREKLAQERLFRQAAEACGVDLLIGRFSNLYGPGQDLSKPQGLVAHVGRAALLRKPVSIYVPLDTIRDYLFAPDAGGMAVGALDRSGQERLVGGPRKTTTKIFASEVETTVASVVAAWRQALHRSPRIALAASPAAELQPRTLSFRSRVWTDLRGRPTLLPLGIDALRRDQLARLMAGGFG